MAGEEIFTSNAVLVVASMGVLSLFFYISWKEGSRIFQFVWALAMLLTMTYGFTVQRIGFNATGLYDLRDLAFTLMEVMIWAFLALMFLTAGVLMSELARAASKAMRGHRGKDDG